MKSKDSSLPVPQPSPPEDAALTVIRTDEAIKMQNQAASEPGHDTQIRRAETRTKQAETRTEEAKTRTEQAETRTEQAETRTEQAETRTEQAKTRTEQAEVRTEEAETRSEQAIRDSEFRYRRLFEATQDGILILDASTGRISDVNPFLIKMLGFSRDELVGTPIWELGPFKDIVANKAKFEQLHQQGYVLSENLPLETRDGRKIVVEFVTNVYHAGDRNAIQCNVRDITERKRMEAAIIRLASIVEASDDAIMSKDLNGIITSWNRGAEKIFGYTAGEIVGTSIKRLIPRDRLGEETQILEKIRRGESLEHYETLRQAKDGRLINVSVTTSPITDASGKVIGISKVAQNITERKAAEENIRQLNVDLEQRVVKRTEELQNANEQLASFSYSVSHDLQAPLRHVTGFVELLQKEAGPSLSKGCLGHLTTISESAQRMRNLIEDLLSFARIGQSEMQKMEVNLNELVREIVGEFQEKTKDRNIVWELQPLPPLQANCALLRMVLVNLISNAVKFTGTRAESKIEIGSVPGADGETVIFIRDNGAGFDPKYAGKLFGVFQRLHNQAEFEGTGIGLANVQRIIQRHGGRVWAEGVVDGGATFYFSIPRQSKEV